MILSTGGVSGRETPPGRDNLPGRDNPPLAGRTPPDRENPPGPDTPPGSRLQHTVYERLVRILLECILVKLDGCSKSDFSYYHLQTKLREGYVFIGVCDSVNRGHAWLRGVRAWLRGGHAWLLGGGGGRA